MNKKIVGAAFGLVVLAASSAASAHVDLAIGVGIPAPVYVPTAPVYVAPGPAVYAPVGYVDRDDWRAREWREHREWREREWRREAWRDHEWRERARWGGD